MPADRPAAIDSGGALILAAGLGRRFGSDKRRYRLEDGTPMLLRTLGRYTAIFPDSRVVLRPGDEALAAEIQQRYPAVQPLYAEDAHLGMGHSLAAAISLVARDWAFACVGLGDMPYIEPETLAALWAEFQTAPPDSIVQPVFNDQPGHPVLFPDSCFDAMCQLSGDEGARRLISSYQQALIRLPVADAGVIRDVDRAPEPDSG